MMKNFRPAGAGSPYTNPDMTDANLNVTMNQTGHFYCQPSRHMHAQQPIVSHEPSPTDYLSQYAGQWPPQHLPRSRLQQHHLSILTQSSGSSNDRSSNSSFLFDVENRASVLSNASSLSNLSIPPLDLYPPRADSYMNIDAPTPSSYAPSPIEGPQPNPSRRRAASRGPVPDKNPYCTCVSRKQRARRPATAQNYFCTACGEPFVEKADWKRHEEIYQERPEEFYCELCDAKYFLDRDFATHHAQTHGCRPCGEKIKCSEKRHVLNAKKQRITRTGWGCGFCYHFSDDWIDRCNHIAQHYEKEHKTMQDDWNHSVAIYSLLLRPELVNAWHEVIQAQQKNFVGFGWDPRTTSRKEGYPDSTLAMHLQDALEFFTPGQNAMKLAQLAYDMAVKKIERTEVVDAAPPPPPSLPPPPPPPPPPPVPVKGFRDHHNASLQDLMKDLESWNQLIDSVVEDPNLPTNVCTPDENMLEDMDMSWINFDA